MDVGDTHHYCIVMHPGVMEIFTDLILKGICGYGDMCLTKCGTENRMFCIKSEKFGILLQDIFDRKWNYLSPTFFFDEIEMLVIACSKHCDRHVEYVKQNK